MEFDDVGSSDLRELWESYLAETAMGHDVSITNRDDDNNWGSPSCNTRDKTTPCVVLRDRLMTDAALGGPRPIKSEHSYSLASSPPSSPAIPHASDSPDVPSTENSLSVVKTTGTTSLINGHQVLVLRNRIDDMEEECFPAISLNRASGRGASAESPSPSPVPSLPLNSRSNSPTTTNSNSNVCITLDTCRKTDTVDIKEEPFSPETTVNYTCNRRSTEVETVAIAPYQLHFGRSASAPYATSDSEDDEAEYYQSMELEESNGEPSPSSSSSIAITIANGNGNGNGSGRQGLPPTPPSSASSDSEGAASASCSPERRVSESLRGLLAPRFCGVTGANVTRGSHMHGHVTRQPIHTPLISCQPKGSTGILTLTEEEKRTLIAEGYPVPTKLPLTKQEEKSLKKVRRKIKNKISAQESRRKKKEYMDGLERRVSLLAQENSSYKDRLTNLEGTNRELMRELQRLQSMLRSS